MSLEEEAYNIEPAIAAAPATGSIGWDINPPTDKGAGCTTLTIAAIRSL